MRNDECGNANPLACSQIAKLLLSKYERGTIKAEYFQRSAFRIHHSTSGGDDRIRTCEGLLTLNGLANRRLQPLGHISVPERGENQF